MSQISSNKVITSCQRGQFHNTYNNSNKKKQYTALSKYKVNRWTGYMVMTIAQSYKIPLLVKKTITYLIQ